MALSPREKIGLKKVIDNSFERLETESGLSPREKIKLKREIENAFTKLDEAIDLNPETAAENEKLTRLKNGEYDSLAPAEFIRILREIVDEINDIEPIKPPTIRYISDRLKKA